MRCRRTSLVEGRRSRQLRRPAILVGDAGCFRPKCVIIIIMSRRRMLYEFGLAEIGFIDDLHESKTFLFLLTNTYREMKSELGKMVF
jgi:hypothetical protein